jgi:hypothetical protein
MRKIMIAASAGLSFFVTTALPAHAAEAIAPDAFAKRLLAARSLDQKNQACFLRRYDAAHLAHHPKQTVTMMRLLVTAEKRENDKQVSYELKFGVNFHDRTGDFAANHFCGHARVESARQGGTTINCHEGCEDGGLNVALGPRDKSVIVKIEGFTVSLAGRANDEDGWVELRGDNGKDDGLFRLDRVELSECAGLGEDNEMATPTQ